MGTAVDEELECPPSVVSVAVACPECARDAMERHPDYGYLVCPECFCIATPAGEAMASAEVSHIVRAARARGDQVTRRHVGRPARAVAAKAAPNPRLARMFDDADAAEALEDRNPEASPPRDGRRDPRPDRRTPADPDAAASKQAAYRARCRRERLCPHCGQPCAPYAECEERRAYKRERGKLPIVRIIEAVESLPENDRGGPETDTYRAAVVFLAGGTVGHNAATLALFTGYDEAWVAELRARLVADKIWEPRGLRLCPLIGKELLSEECGYLTIWLCVLVALGKIRRSRGQDSSLWRALTVPEPT